MHGRLRALGRAWRIARENNGRGVHELGVGGTEGNIESQNRGCARGRPCQLGQGRGIEQGRDVQANSKDSSNDEVPRTVTPPRWAPPQIEPRTRSPHRLRYKYPTATPLQPVATPIGSHMSDATTIAYGFSPHSTLEHHCQRRRVNDK